MRRARKASSAPTADRPKKTRKEAPADAHAEAAPPSSESVAVIEAPAPPPPQADVYVTDDNKKFDEEGLNLLRTFIATTTNLRLRSPSDSPAPLRRACSILLADNATIAKQVTHLALSAPIDVNVMAGVIAAMPKLVVLDLSLSRFVGDGGVPVLLDAVLASGASLRELHLSYCHVSEALIPKINAHVTKNLTLRRLHLEGNDISDASAAALVDALIARSQPLHHLGLSSNTISDGAPLAKLVAAGDALQLATLDVYQNQLNFAAAQQVAEALARNRSIRYNSVTHAQRPARTVILAID